MKTAFETTRKPLDTLQADLACCFVFQGDRDAAGIAKKELRAALTALMTEERFEGRKGESVLWYTNGSYPARRYAVIGLGKKDRFDPGGLRDAIATAVHKAEGVSARALALALPPGAGAGLQPRDRVQAIVEGALLGNYKFDKYLNEANKKARPLEKVTLVSDAPPEAARDGIRIGRITSEATCLARDLVCEPAGVLTPAEMARRAKELARKAGVEYTVLERKDMEKLGMGAFLGVNVGSPEPPKLIHLVYRPKGKAQRRVALVGKGITFDSGGLNLKPTGSIETMKCDMAGSAAVLATVLACPSLKIPVEVHGFMAMTENMPGGRAQKPGDVVRTLKGKTVEINNTDAEGRLVLCDTIAYAHRFKPEAIIDLATLTGACVVALGPLATGVMSNNPRLSDAILKAAAVAGEKMWPLPLYEEYADMLNSDIADMKNTGERWGGALTAGLFLQEFVDETMPWAHLDIAGPAYIEREIPLSRKGGSGAGVLTLLQYLSNGA